MNKPSPASSLIIALWWICIPYTLLVPLLTALSGSGWAFAHVYWPLYVLLMFSSLGSLVWMIMMLYKVFVIRSVRLDPTTSIMLGLSGLAAIF